MRKPKRNLSLTFFVISLCSLQSLDTYGQSKLTSNDKHASQYLIDKTVPDDPNLSKLIEPYRNKVRELDVIIGKLDTDLKKGGIGAGTLGNFVVDAMRSRAEGIARKRIDLSIHNSGGLRKNLIAAGDLKVNDIFQLLPFENSLVLVDLSGEQLMQLLNVVVKNRDAQSGARITFNANSENEYSLVSVKLDNGRKISKTSMYRIVTIDYLVGRGGEYSILKEAKLVQPLNVTTRDAVIEYVKVKGGKPLGVKLDGRFEMMKGKKK